MNWKTRWAQRRLVFKYCFSSAFSFRIKKIHSFEKPKLVAYIFILSRTFHKEHHLYPAKCMKYHKNPNDNSPNTHYDLSSAIHSTQKNKIDSGWFRIEKQKEAIICRRLLTLFVFSSTNLNSVTFSIQWYTFFERTAGTKIFCWHVPDQYCFYYSYFVVDYAFLLWKQKYISRSSLRISLG